MKLRLVAAITGATMACATGLYLSWTLAGKSTLRLLPDKSPSTRDQNEHVDSIAHVKVPRSSSKIGHTQNHQTSFSRMPKAVTPLDSVVASNTPSRDDSSVGVFHMLSTQPYGDTTVSEEVGNKISHSLEAVQSMLREDETRRSKVEESYEDGGFRSSMIKIVPPTKEQISAIKRQREEIEKQMPKVEAVFFHVETQRLIDQFTALNNKTLVVYLVEPTSATDNLGNFHSYLTDRPEEFTLAPAGQPIGIPKKVTPYDTGSLFNSKGESDGRFRHLLNLTRN